MPKRVEESVNQIVPSAATAALLVKTIGTPSTVVTRSSTAPSAGSTASSPRSASHTSSRPSPSSSMPSGRPPVRATRRMRSPPSSRARIDPSTRPVQTTPSSSTTTSSGPLPGTGQTSAAASTSLRANGPSSGMWGGGVHTRGSIGGFGVSVMREA